MQALATYQPARGSARRRVRGVGGPPATVRTNRSAVPDQSQSLLIQGSATQDLRADKFASNPSLTLRSPGRPGATTNASPFYSSCDKLPQGASLRLNQKLSFYRLFNRPHPALAASNAATKRLRSTGHGFYSDTLSHGVAAKNSLFINVSLPAGPPSLTAKARRSKSICNLHFTICNLLFLLATGQQPEPRPRVPFPNTALQVNDVLPVSSQLDMLGGLF